MYSFFIRGGGGARLYGPTICPKDSFGVGHVFGPFLLGYIHNWVKELRLLDFVKVVPFSRWRRYHICLNNITNYVLRCKQTYLYV